MKRCGSKFLHLGCRRWLQIRQPIPFIEPPAGRAFDERVLREVIENGTADDATDLELQGASFPAPQPPHLHDPDQPQQPEEGAEVVNDQLRQGRLEHATW